MNITEDTKRILNNARKAKEAADKLFPGEEWILVEKRIYRSPHRPIGKKSNYLDELMDAQILRDLGSTVYLVPEIRSESSKKYDAIVDGEIFEFKNIGGNANTLITQFLYSRTQAPNVFINLETSSLSFREIISALYGARNSITHINKKGSIIRGYEDISLFTGGRIILNIKEQEKLIYLNVDDLKLIR